MKTSHTPGNWKYTIHPIKRHETGTTPGSGSIHAPSNKLIFGRDPRNTIVYLPGFYKDEELAEIEANARLIASAPELLEALQEITNLLEDEDLFPIHTEKARELISKATGVNQDN
jgi:hypothetical protein